MNFLWPVLFLFAVVGAVYLLRRERRLRSGLERQISELRQKFQRASGKLEEERARLETTFSGMVEGVLLTDGRGDILYTNPPLRGMFGLKGKAEGRSALEVLTSVAADDAIRHVLQKGEPVEREIHFEKPGSRVFQVHFSPIRRDGKLSGVVSVFHDLTEIRRLEEVRRDFIANLSHELKTPLTAIQGYAETLLEECREEQPDRPHPPELRKHVEIIFRHATELSHLMENLLNLSRIESGREEVVFEKIDLKAFVDQIFERFQSQARVKGIELTNEAATHLEADPTKLNQILSNLIDNAIKYIPNSSDVGRIWVRSRLEGKDDLAGRPSVCIEVEDTGSGIPEADQERIFEKFYRVDKARSRDSGGTGWSSAGWTSGDRPPVRPAPCDRHGGGWPLGLPVPGGWPGAGLGLAIVKHLTELQGGRVRVFSEPGHGSKFQIFLPQT